MTSRALSPLETEVVARWGTPAYLYDLDEVHRSCARLRAALPDGSRAYYSLKANPHPDVVSAVADAGMDLEVSSLGELAVAVRCEVPGREIIYTGPGKDRRELKAALRMGVQTFSVESACQLVDLVDAAAKYSVGPRILLRIHLMDGASGGLHMSGAPSQFGMSIGEAERLLANSGLAEQVGGVHFFPLSNARDADELIYSMRLSIAAAARLQIYAGRPFEEIDLGGGFPAPFAETEEAHLLPGVSEVVTAQLDRYGLPAGAVSFESGRYVAATCGTLLARVVDEKVSGGNRFVILDTGIHHLAGLAATRRMFPRDVAIRASHEMQLGAARQFLVGPLCTPVDVLSKRRDLRDLAVGDVIAVDNVGAYGLTASPLGFLSRPTPAEVVTSGGEIVSATHISLVREPLLDA